MKMKRVFGTLLMVAVVVAMPVVAAEKIRGSVSDKMCGADHHGQDAVACTLSCVKAGSPFVLVVSKDKILDVENQGEAKIKAELEKYAGKAVTVTGTVSKDGKSVKIASIEAAS
jgi:hypothetical protein